MLNNLYNNSMIISVVEAARCACKDEHYSASTRPLLRLRRRRVALYLGMPAVVAIFIQLGIGASPWVVLLATVIVTTGLLAFLKLGAYNLGSWLALFYVLGNVLVALYAKTLMGQPLNSHLYAPVDSFFVLAVTSSALLLALLLVKDIRLGKPLLASPADQPTLARLSWGSFVLGCVFWFINQHFQGPGGSGFGGIAVFRDLLLMAIIARTAMLLEGSGDRITFDKISVLMIGTGVFLGLLLNSKTQTAYPVVSYFATLLFYRRGLPWRQVLLLAVSAVVFIGFITPMIQAWRYLGQQQMDVPQRITLMTEGVGAVLEGGKLNQFVSLGEIGFSGGYYDYFGGNGRGQQVLGRYASVQQIDPVIAEINKQGPIGGSVIWPALTHLLPRFIYPGKPKYARSYVALVDLGLISPAGGKFPTLPLAGQAYAGYGVAGLLLIPFFTFLAFALVLKKLGWHLYRNVYAIFLFSTFILVYANQGSLGQYAGFILRNVPLFWAVFWLLTRRIRLWPRRFISTSTTVASGPEQ